MKLNQSLLKLLFFLLVSAFWASWASWGGEDGDSKDLCPDKKTSSPVADLGKISLHLSKESLSEKNCSSELKEKARLLQVLQTWIAHATSLIGKERSTREGTKFRDSKRIIESIENYLVKGYVQLENVILICDQEKQLRALAIVDDKKESKQSEFDALEIVLLATNPHNFSHPENGAKIYSHVGKNAIQVAIERSLQRGHGGKIILEPTDGAKPFYESLGLEEIPSDKTSFNGYSSDYSFEAEEEFVWPARMILTKARARLLHPGANWP